MINKRIEDLQNLLYNICYGDNGITDTISYIEKKIEKLEKELKEAEKKRDIAYEAFCKVPKTIIDENYEGDSIEYKKAEEKYDEADELVDGIENDINYCDKKLEQIQKIINDINCFID